MPTASRQDPFRAYKFRVEIQGIQRAGFRECSGLDITADPIAYREGSDAVTHHIPGQVKYSHITLKWGITNDPDLWEWIGSALQGEVKRRHGSIILVNDAGNALAQWDFIDAWPTKWTGPSLNATGNEVAIETLELVHEGISKK